jgi:hypothetical protein
LGLVVLQVAAWATGADATTAEAAKAVVWDVESLARVVKPMRHDAKGRMPLLWNFRPEHPGTSTREARAPGSALPRL